MLAKEVKQGRTFAVRFRAGEEIVSALEAFAGEKKLKYASVHLIGAVTDITLGYLKLKTPDNEVVKHSFPGSHEFLGIGNISTKDGKPSAHIHAFIGDEKKSLNGGHLVSAKVSVTIEGFIHETDTALDRTMDPSVRYQVLDL